MGDSKIPHILQHSLGMDRHGHGGGYRNFFATGADSDDHTDCLRATNAGLMKKFIGNAITGGDDVFLVTEAGRAYIAEHSPPAPKLTRSQSRYRAFLREDSSISFGDWLRAQRFRRAASAQGEKE